MHACTPPVNLPMISGMVRTRVKVGKDTCEPRNQPPIDRQPWRMAVKLIKSFSPIYQRDTAPSRACTVLAAFVETRSRSRDIHNATSRTIWDTEGNRGWDSGGGGGARTISRVITFRTQRLDSSTPLGYSIHAFECSIVSLTRGRAAIVETNGGVRSPLI